jgi:DNA helicase II / ATP-dependent DNA helicase PcrA
VNNDLFKTLNTAQKQAVDTIDGPVLVIAGPGTGKTQLLALRAANILLKTDTAPQNILCLTYTEVGARNMRERLASLIGQPAYDIRISTYHGFGSELIRQYGEYFNEFGGEKPIDKLGQIKLLNEIFDDLPSSNPLWRADVYLKDTLSFIGECKKALIMPDDIKVVAKDNQKFIEEASAIISTTIPTFSKINKEHAKYFVELLPKVSNIKSNSSLPNNIKPLKELLVTELGKAIDDYNLTGKTNSITTFKTKWLTKNGDNNWILNGQKEVRKLLGASDIYQKYLDSLVANKLFDYDDMIYRAIKGLENNNDLRYSLHEQFLYLMLDEFQDTNKAQLKLVELLTNNPVLEGRANIMAVGDDDQAIYSFQGAELSNMITFTKMYKDVKVITLTDNYRSHTSILESAHSIASTIEERLSVALGKGNKVLSPKNKKLLKATIDRQHFKSDIAQFDWVSHKIQTLITQGTSPQEIAVLAPKHKHIEPLVAYLISKDIPIRYDKRENVLDDNHILELTSMVELIMALSKQDYTLADSLWPNVLSLDFWQLKTSDIWQLSWQSYDSRNKDEPTNWQSLMMQDDNLKPIALFFSKLGQIQQHETLETMIDYLVGVDPLIINEPNIPEYLSPYYNYYFGKQVQESSPNDFIAVLSNLTVLRQHLREYRQETDKPLQLQDMLDFIADYRAADEKLLNTSPYHSSSNAVQLMTAYSAKGLEFDAVFVLACHDEVWGMKDRSPNNNISLSPNLLHLRRAGNTKDEKKRLFYVALTRARHSLYLTSYEQNYAGKATQPLEFLNEVDGHALALPSGMQKINNVDENALAIEPLQHYWTSRHSINQNDTSLKDIIMPRLENFQLSATHLNTFTDLVYGGPEVFFINTILKFPKAPTSDGQFGNAIHETLEAMQQILKKSGELPDLDKAIEIFNLKLKSKKLSENDYNRLRGRGEQALISFIPWWWHNFVPQAQTEYSFKHEGAFIDSAHLSGNLDQLLVDEQSKTIRVVDFKTGKPQPKWKNDLKSHKYKQQLIFYKILVENSHSFKGFLVHESKLVFVEPDVNSDEMYELPINYNAQEIERTEKLIKAVWNCIKNLDLPETQQYSKDIKGILKFEEWLIENK